MDRSTKTPASSTQLPLLSRRHKSLPSRTHSASLSPVDSTSPEVISSLISSLSTISIPLQSHFEGTPRVNSDTDPPYNSSLRLDPLLLDHSYDQADNALELTSDALGQAECQQQSPFLHPDDAATFPVVRMARAPLSPKPKPPSAADYLPARPTSGASYASPEVEYEDSIFGMITAEPGPLRNSTALSIASASSGGRKSLRGQLGLRKRSSREIPNVGQKRVERLRKTSSYNDSLRCDNFRSGVSLRSMHSTADLAEESHSAITAMGPQKENNALKFNSLQNVKEGYPDSTEATGGRTIPARESSLRHSSSLSTKRYQPVRHNRYSFIGSKDTADSSIRANTEAEQITKRIQEFKDQQQRVKIQLNAGRTGNSPGESIVSGLPEATMTSQALVEKIGRQSESGEDDASGDNEGAPSPAIMTGKSRARVQPGAADQSLERRDWSERVGRRRRSLEPSTPTVYHRRLSSVQLSPGYEAIVNEHKLSTDPLDRAVSEYVSSPRFTQKVKHPTSGRTIAFSEVGDPKGHVVICCLGMGLTRYLMTFYDELARTLKLRLITLDRPGIGESEPYVDGSGGPLSWPDDVAIVCNHLKVTKFSLLGHSAGAIYALATALRIPQHIRGRLHLLAPWIPQSQLLAIGPQKTPVPASAVPYSQRILRALPTPLLRVANSSFLSATGASITGNLSKSSRRRRRGATAAIKDDSPEHTAEDIPRRSKPNARRTVTHLQETERPAVIDIQNYRSTVTKSEANITDSYGRERQTEYDIRLTHKIWELATANANPAVDLMTCLERRQTVGFQYVDITRAVVIHHGSRDTRVPVDNVRWLAKTMRRCETRILEGEGHGLMASAAVMGNVLMEIAKEWEDWMTVVQGKRLATITQGAQRRIPIQA